jgi:hypothetical protein
MTDFGFQPGIVDFVDYWMLLTDWRNGSFSILARLRLRPTRYIGKGEPRRMGITGRFQWTPVEPEGTCPLYGSLTLDGSEDPWTTGACDDDSTIRGGRTA